jgi:hypothetical protein
MIKAILLNNSSNVLVQPVADSHIKEIQQHKFLKGFFF